MIQNFEINSGVIDKIKKISKEEKNFRIKNLEVFNSKGFPNKRNEDWKFSDLKEIINKDFKSLNVKNVKSKVKKINLINDFEHNYIFLVNGHLTSSDLKFEEKDKIKITSLDKSGDIKKESSDNSLVCLNHALSNEGYFLQVKKNYKFKKVLVVYNLFTKDLKNNILNSKNKIKIGENSELHIVDFTVNESKNKFINNVYEDVYLEKNSVFKNISIQNNKSLGYFHKFSKNKIQTKANYSTFIFSSGLKFNKLDMQFDLEGENSNCDLQSALFLDKENHQEIKTKMNHLVPNCKSHQIVKKVLEADAKGVYQGKIYVKDQAQKTDAYQLSKALLLSDNSEFNSKPELEIYADDVKCSHGSSSGNVDQDAIHYLMTRGLSKKDSVKLLINGFLNEITEMIKSNSIRNFVVNKLEGQIHGS